MDDAAVRADAEAVSQNLPDPKTILNSIGEIIYDWNILSDGIVWGPNAAEVLGLGDIASLSSGRRYGEYLAAESPASRYETIMASTNKDNGSGVPYKVTYGLVIATAGKSIIWVEDTGRWFADVFGRPARAHGIIRIVTEHYEAERQLAHQSRVDKLTGAITRPYFIDKASQFLNAPGNNAAAVLVASLENLPTFNQTYGYAIGDELLAAAAARIREHMRARDVIARYGGNKFALLLEACDSEQMTFAAERFLSSVENAPLPTSAGLISVSMRIGAIAAKPHDRNPQILLHHAEEALDCARQPAATHFIAYEANRSTTDAQAHTRQVSLEITTALDERRLVLAVQPIVFASTGKLAFYEGLMRIKSQNGFVIGPMTVLPIAEKTGLVSSIDGRILELAAAQLARDPTLRMAINASGATVHAPRWPDQLAAVCESHPGIASRLTIEITETCAIVDIEATGRAIAAMKSCGVKVAMDDFGAGHTSFRNLRGLDIDLIKIDGAFVQNLARSPDDRFFVRTLLELAHHLRIPTVAEWVEDAETARILAEWGVDYLQGHHYGEAVILEDDLARRNRAVA